jgi:RNA polymerase sigma-70 factor (ECF subfamily)
VSHDEFIPTRRSLLSRLRNWQDRPSWQQFFDIYSKLIYRTAQKAGLRDAEAEDVVQESLIVVARKIPGFKYDPALGSFKSWLLIVVRRRIEKQLNKRLPTNSQWSSDLAWSGASGTNHARASEETKRTSTVDRVADPQGFDLEAVWNNEWEKHLWDTALARVKPHFKPKQFQMFDLYVLKEWPVHEVAHALGVSTTHVYVTKHRIAARLRLELRALRRRLHW